MVFHRVGIIPSVSGFGICPIKQKCRGSIGRYWNIRARKDLEDWLKRVDLPYHSPHKFRHGNAVYSLKRVKDVAKLKAISQNLMHANLSVTDGVYGILSETDVKKQIISLGQMIANSQQEKLSTLISLAKQLEYLLRVQGLESDEK